MIACQKLIISGEVYFAEIEAIMPKFTGNHLLPPDPPEFEVLGVEDEWGEPAPEMLDRAVNEIDYNLLIQEI